MTNQKSSCVLLADRHHGLRDSVGPARNGVRDRVHEPTVAEAALIAGAEGVVLKRSLATDLLPAIEALRAGRRYLSPRLSR